MIKPKKYLKRAYLRKVPGQRAKIRIAAQLVKRPTR